MHLDGACTGTLSGSAVCGDATGSVALALQTTVGPGETFSLVMQFDADPLADGLPGGIPFRRGARANRLLALVRPIGHRAGRPTGADPPGRCDPAGGVRHRGRTPPALRFRPVCRRDLTATDVRSGRSGNDLSLVSHGGRIGPR